MLTMAMSVMACETPRAPSRPPAPVADSPRAAGPPDSSHPRPLRAGEPLGLLPFALDPVTPRPDGTSGQVTCRESGRWIVVSIGFDDQVGSDLLIRPAATGSCAPDSLPGDLVLRNQDAEYFEGTWEDRLFVDSGTGPDARGLMLYALPSGERLLATTIAEGLFRTERVGELQVWEAWDLRDSIPGCGHRPGMTPVIDSLVRIDLRTGRRTPTTIARCSNWT